MRRTNVFLALAHEDGRILIQWSSDVVEGIPTFAITWAEHGGPLVKIPTRIGFGRTIIERMIAGTLEGKAALEFPFTGVVWTFACPCAKAVEGTG